MKKVMIKTLVLVNVYEDARDLCTLLNNLQMNLDIVIAVNAERFISIFTSEQIDFFILDDNYEHSPIFNFVSEIRKNNKYLWTPIALLVDKKEPHRITSNLKLKIDLRIYRPFNEVYLKEQFEIILNKKFDPKIPKHFEIMVLEDNPGVINFYIEYFRQHQHTKYKTCTSICEAKKLVNEKYYDLLLLDWNLEDGTCIDLIEFLRSKKQKIDFDETLIVVITGRDDVDDILTLLNYQVIDYLIKPFVVTEFEDKLTYALERHNMLKKA